MIKEKVVRGRIVDPRRLVGDEDKEYVGLMFFPSTHVRPSIYSSVTLSIRPCVRPSMPVQPSVCVRPSDLPPAHLLI